jgi:hypothetical protein
VNQLEYLISVLPSLVPSSLLLKNTLIEIIDILLDDSKRVVLSSNPSAMSSAARLVTLVRGPYDAATVQILMSILICIVLQPENIKYIGLDIMRQVVYFLNGNDDNVLPTLLASSSAKNQERARKETEKVARVEGEIAQRMETVWRSSKEQLAALKGVDVSDLHSSYHGARGVDVTYKDMILHFVILLLAIEQVDDSLEENATIIAALKRRDMNMKRIITSLGLSRIIIDSSSAAIQCMEEVDGSVRVSEDGVRIVTKPLLHIMSCLDILERIINFDNRKNVAGAKDSSSLKRKKPYDDEVATERDSYFTMYKALRCTYSIIAAADRTNPVFDLLWETYLSALKVLMNVTNNNDTACNYLLQFDAIETIVDIVRFSIQRRTESNRDLASRKPSMNSELTFDETASIFDSNVMALGLLTNLVERHYDIRLKVSKVLVSRGDVSGDVKFISFLSSALVLQTQTINVSEGDGVEDVQDSDMSENLILGAYMCLLLGCLMKHIPSNRPLVFAQLPSNDESLLIRVADAFIALQHSVGILTDDVHLSVLDIIKTFKGEKIENNDVRSSQFQPSVSPQGACGLGGKGTGNLNTERAGRYSSSSQEETASHLSSMSMGHSPATAIFVDEMEGMSIGSVKESQESGTKGSRRRRGSTKPKPTAAEVAVFDFDL